MIVRYHLHYRFRVDAGTLYALTCVVCRACRRFEDVVQCTTSWPLSVASLLQCVNHYVNVRTGCATKINMIFKVWEQTFVASVSLSPLSVCVLAGLPDHDHALLAALLA